MTTALLVPAVCVLILAAWVIGWIMGKDDAPMRVQIERDRCAQLCGIIPHFTDVAEQMAAEHHASRIRAAILRTVPPQPQRHPQAVKVGR